jgi:hypothetical protein
MSGTDRDSLRPHIMNLNTQTHHVGGWYTTRFDVLDKINEWFEERMANGDTTMGMLGGRVDKELKDSTDIPLRVNRPLEDEYFGTILAPVFDEYTRHHLPVGKLGDLRVAEPTNVQQYEPKSGGFAHWHYENVGSIPEITRQLVFMTYLNDVADGGETEFWDQNLQVKPEKGLTLIFPAFWTHLHRGRGSPSQYKRIVTGWFNVKTNDDKVDFFVDRIEIPEK